MTSGGTAQTTATRSRATAVSVGSRMAKTSMELGPVQYDATLSDFDKPVELEAPPAGQVVSPPSS